MKCYYARMAKREGNLIVNKFDIGDDFGEKLSAYTMKVEEEELRVNPTVGEDLT